MSRAIIRNAVLVIPLLLVNSVAVWGQAGWAYEHLLQVWSIAFGFAAAIESVGVYLAWEAHDALLNDQASGLLRLGSYAVGGLAGALNYAHFAGEAMRPTALAVTFAALSSISPWLWAIRSRALNRARLAQLELVDVRGVRLSTARKVWHPIRSLRVVRWAAWSGVTSPTKAVAGWEVERGLRPAESKIETLVAPVPLSSPTDMIMDMPARVRATAHVPESMSTPPGTDLVMSTSEVDIDLDTTGEYALVDQREGRPPRRTQDETRAMCQVLRTGGADDDRIAALVGIDVRRVRRLIGRGSGPTPARINGHNVIEQES